MRIPIFTDYNYAEDPIGFFEDGVVKLTSPLTKETIFTIFGNIGFIVNKDEWQDKIYYIKEFKIICWSILPRG